MKKKLRRSKITIPIKYFIWAKYNITHSTNDNKTNKNRDSKRETANDSNARENGKDKNDTELRVQRRGADTEAF